MRRFEPTNLELRDIRESMSSVRTRPPKVLAVASAGGHWIQMQRITPALDGSRVTYVTTNGALQQQVEGSEFIVVTDASRWTKLRVLRLTFEILRIVVANRPDVVISTGAAPGCLAIIFGKLFAAKTIWIDSIANAEQLSLSGRMVRRFADAWLTQWPHLAGNPGPSYHGSVL